MRGVIMITMDDMSQAVSGSRKTVSGTIHVVGLVYPFTESVMQSFTVLAHEIAGKGEAILLKATCC